MSINIIAAISKNRVIGLNGSLPWKIPGELKYFKDTTTGQTNGALKGRHACLMGRKTWQSLPTYPEPLSDRGCYVVTKKNVFATRATLSYPEIPTIDELVRIQKIYPNIWICGGESIYNYYINKPYVDKLYLTEIDKEIEGDTFFPEIPSYFCKTIEGKRQLWKENAMTFTGYRCNIYSNCSFPRF